MKKLIITRAVFASFLLVAFVQYAICQNYAAKHAMSPASYQTEYDNMKSKGLRLVSVTGYTKDGNELYAAIWNKKTGPAMATLHGMSSESYQTNVEDYKKQGYRLASVSGYAVNGSAKFAAIWHKTGDGDWGAKHNMTAEQYQAAYDDYKRRGYQLSFVNGYVVRGQELFAAVWEKSTQHDIVAKHNLTSAQYQQAFNDFGKQGYKLKVVSGYEKNGTDLFAAIWKKTAGPHWASRHGVSRFNYQHVYDNMYYQGYEPVYIDAYAGNGTDNYNVIWENTNMKAADLAKLDAALKDYLTAQGVTGISLAVTKNGRLVYAKGAGWADPVAKEEMSPKHSLRIMSISKPVTAAGIYKLMENGHPTLLQKKVFGKNGILNGYTIPDNLKTMNDITVSQLLYHNSGMRTGNGETPFNDANATHDDVANHLLALDNLMSTVPNTKNEYSNLGYFWLMMVIEKLSGKTYEDYIRNNVLTPAGIGQSMYVGLATGEIKPGEVHYTPNVKRNFNNWAGFGGWVARPMDLLKFINRFDGSPTPPDLISAATHDSILQLSPLSNSIARGWWLTGDKRQWHNGSKDATYSVFEEMADGLSIAIIINSSPANANPHNVVRDAVKAVSAFPPYDLF